LKTVNTYADPSPFLRFFLALTSASSLSELAALDTVITEGDEGWLVQKILLAFRRPTAVDFTGFGFSRAVAVVLPFPFEPWVPSRSLTFVNAASSHFRLVVTKCSGPSWLPNWKIGAVGLDAEIPMGGRILFGWVLYPGNS
jgi:hypothetical protein